MLQSVPVLNQSVVNAFKATCARGSPLAVTRGSRNLAGSSGAVAAAKGEGMTKAPLLTR